MGIDIRDGAQLECIHCALCIDACDKIMERIDRPKGLIAYDTDTAVAARAVGEAPPRHRLIRMRTLVYTGLITLIGCTMLFGLLTKPSFEVNVLKDRSPPFVQLSNGDIRNGYTLKLVNKAAEPRMMTVDLIGLDGADFTIIGIEREEDSQLTVPVAAHGVDRYRVLVTAPVGGADRRVVFSVSDTQSGEVETARAAFRGPK